MSGMDLGLLGSFSVTTIVLGMAVCFAAGMLGGLSGFGTGMLVTLFITPIVGAKALIPVISVLMLINNGSRAWFFRSAMDVRLILKVAGAAVPMAFLGALFYVRLESGMVQALLGGVLIAAVPLRRWVARKEFTPGPAGVVAVGGLYGFLSSVIVGAGMLVIPMLLGLGLSGPALLATDATIAVLVNLSKVIFFGGLDAMSRDLFLLALLMGLCTIPGTGCAAWLVRRTHARLHTALIEGLIVLGGASMMLGAVWSGLNG